MDQTARAIIPSARCANVDNDPLTVAHAQALLARDDGLAVVDADLVDPAAVTGNPEFRGVIDLAEPVCVILSPVLNLFPAGKAREIIAGYADLAAPRSLFVVSFGRGLLPRDVGQLAKAFTAAEVHNHTREETAGFLGGLELADPGLVPAQNWRAGWRHIPATPPSLAYILGGVACKPG